MINVNASDITKSSTGAAANQWQHMAAGGASSSTWNEYPNDPNLARYLKLGRRHTLGAAHNHMLMPPSDLGHLREASECSSQTSNDIGIDITTTTSPIEIRSLQSTLTSGHAETQSQSGSSPLSRASLMQPLLKSRMGRRASDGGPYAAVFRLYLEKRMPQLAQIDSRGSLHDSTTLSSSSVKQLLLDKKSQENQFGKLSTQSKEWLQYKDQVSIHGLCAKLLVHMSSKGYCSCPVCAPVCMSVTTYSFTEWYIASKSMPTLSLPKPSLCFALKLRYVAYSLIGQVWLVDVFKPSHMRKSYLEFLLVWLSNSLYNSCLTGNVPRVCTSVLSLHLQKMLLN